MTNPRRGRPSDYSFQVAISICARLAEGKSLRAICSEVGMPGRATIFRWIARHKEFRDEYSSQVREPGRIAGAAGPVHRTCEYRDARLGF